jgi:tripartite-type tricarboxylate transporter receptor subunit TctC
MTPALAQVSSGSMDYPSKPVRWVVPYSAGASNDVVARMVAQKLSVKWGHAVVVENRAGAGGTIGTNIVAKAEPDGYTLLMSNPGSNAINFAFNAQSPYEPTDFTHIILLGSAPLMLSTNVNFPASNLQELLALARAKPGQLTGGSSGNGGSSHLALELFKLSANVDIRHIPYKGAAPAINDLAGGQISMVFTTPASVHALLEAGKFKAIAISATTRNPSFPDVPTMAEQGLSDFNDRIWFGVSAPAGTPRTVVMKINQDLNDVIRSPDIQAKFKSLGLDVDGGSPEYFSQEIARDIERLSQLIKKSNIETNRDN